jgi:acyl transferase domain-containing protein
MRRPLDSEIAIIGMDCIFPGAANLGSFWRNIQDGHEAFIDVPKERWEPVFYDPEVTGPDRVYCRRGGFIDEFAEFDAVSWGVMPVAANASEPDQLLALDVAARCLRDAGYEERAFPREKTGVVLGRGGYLNAGQAKLVQSVRTSQELANCLRKLLPDLDQAKIDEIRQEYISKVGRLAPDTVIGLVPNLAASRIANRLDLNGSSYTVDAACASSLLAVERACTDLASGRSDLMLAGGVHVTQDVTFWSVFCQLGALSRNQTMRPFDERADGLLIGEGVGMVVLKRLRDAERDGDRIYSVIRGVGSSSDGRESSLMIPQVKGQLLALERAWSAAGLDPRAAESVGLIEAHGTATPVGDAAELETMNRFFGSGVEGESAPGLGSVKSMIGHTMPAAGIAGLIKASLAVYHGVLPPTLNCEQPHPDLERSRFRLITSAEPWPQMKGPRS